MAQFGLRRFCSRKGPAMVWSHGGAEDWLLLGFWWHLRGDLEQPGEPGRSGVDAPGKSHPWQGFCLCREVWRRTKSSFLVQSKGPSVGCNQSDAGE